MAIKVKTGASISKMKPVKKTKKHKSSRKKKKSEKVQKFTTTNGQIELNQTVLIRQRLTGPAKLIDDNELDMLVKMETSLQSIQKRMLNRTIVAGAVVTISLVIGLILRKYFLAIVGLGILFAALTWYLDMRKTTDYYRNYRLERQIAFSQFTRLAAAYLPELSSGANLYSVFKKILPRMDNDRDHASLETLMIDMQIDPNDPGPFMKFAHEFSASDSAEMIMGTIQQMYQGNVDDRNIRALADLANEDMLRQIDDVIKHKINKFNNLTTRVAMCSMVVIFGFFGLLMVDTFVNVAHMVMKNTSNIYGK